MYHDDDDAVIANHRLENNVLYPAILELEFEVTILQELTLRCLNPRVLPLRAIAKTIIEEY